MTTLDSATRLLRYNIEEVGQSFSKGGVKRALGNRFVASGLAVWLTVESVLSFKREKSRS
jgi:carbon starvation protein CstA